MVGRTHHFPVRVYFADTDAAGIVYYANYFAYAERARTEMMRLAGFNHNDLRRQLGLLLAVRSCEADYVRPARLDDLLELRTTVEELGGASMMMRQDVWRESEEIVRMGIRLVCLGADGKPERLPEELHRKIRTFVVKEAI